MSWLMQFDSINCKYPDAYIQVSRYGICIENITGISVVMHPNCSFSVATVSGHILCNQIRWCVDYNQYFHKFTKREEAIVQAKYLAELNKVQFVDPSNLGKLVK